MSFCDYGKSVPDSELIKQRFSVMIDLGRKHTKKKNGIVINRKGGGNFYAGTETLVIRQNHLCMV